jgi:hypothetical protein
VKLGCISKQDEKCTYNFEACLHNHCSKYCILWVQCLYILALVIQHANCIFSLHCYSNLWIVWLNTFFHSSHKWHGFQNKKCVFWFSAQLLSTSSLILIRIQQAIINVHKHLCKLPIILVRLQRNLIFPYRFSKYPQTSNFIQVHPMRAQMFHVDRQTWQSW